jgi:hypothetical protein
MRPDVLLARIFSSPKFRDNSKADANLKALFDMCPTAFDGYEALVRADHDKEVIRKYATQLRPVLQKRDDIDAIAEYRTLWTLEFKATAPAEYESLRERTARDVLRIRVLNLREKREWYDALEEGYRLANDQKKPIGLKINASFMFLARVIQPFSPNGLKTIIPQAMMPPRRSDTHITKNCLRKRTNGYRNVQIQPLSWKYA